MNEWLEAHSYLLVIGGLAAVALFAWAMLSWAGVYSGTDDEERR